MAEKETAQALLHMISALLTINVALCRYLEREHIMSRAAFADYFETAARDWPLEDAAAVVLMQFFASLREAGELGPARVLH